MIDTGLNLTGTLTESCFQQLVDQDHLRVIAEKTAHSAGGSHACKLGIVREFALGTFTHTDLIFSDGSSNLLGRSYLARYQVTFDIPGRKLFLRQDEGKATPDVRRAGD